MARRLTWHPIDAHDYHDGNGVDALPYIDTITPETSKIVEKLIAEEMTKSEKKPKEYLDAMPKLDPPSFGGSIILQTEYDRVKSGRPKDERDIHRYTLPQPPFEKQNDPDAWKAATDNAQAQLEHQQLRALNLELALKYGPEAWKRSNEQMTRLESEYAKQLEEIKDQITQINKRRKLNQLEVGKQLTKLEKEWHELVVKNVEILHACKERREQIQDLQSNISKKQKKEE